MTINPIVRHMILCDDWRVEGPSNHRITIVGVLWNIESLEYPPYPHYHPEFCVFLTLTGGRGQGMGQIVCVFEDTGEKVFATREWPIAFGADPLEVVGIPFRVRECTFPVPGRYSIQFWYNGTMIEERPLKLR